jgi:hypothetical protein
MWIPGHKGIRRNDRTDFLMRKGPEPAVGISPRISRRATGIRRNRKHLDRWKPVSQMRHVEMFIVGQSLNRTNALLKLRSPQLRWVITLRIGHALLRDHLKNLKLSDDDSCRKCQKGNTSRTSYHVFCKCESVASKRLRHLEYILMDSGNYHDVPIKKLLRFILSAGLIRSKC